MMETLPVLFIVTSLILIITPGQDMLLVMSRAIAQGAKAGWPPRPGSARGCWGTPPWRLWGLAPY